MRERAAHLLSPDSPGSPLLWYAPLGSAVAWSLQFGSGYWISEAHCSVAGEHWGIAVSTLTIAIGLAALVVALGSLATSIALLRRTAGASVKGAPPDGRTRFLATVGLTVAPLFIAMIVMTSVGVLVLQPCNQS